MISLVTGVTSATSRDHAGCAVVLSQKEEGPAGQRNRSAASDEAPVRENVGDAHEQLGAEAEHAIAEVPAARQCGTLPHFSVAHGTFQGNEADGTRIGTGTIPRIPMIFPQSPNHAADLIVEATQSRFCPDDRKTLPSASCQAATRGKMPGPCVPAPRHASLDQRRRNDWLSSAASRRECARPTLIHSDAEGNCG